MDRYEFAIMWGPAILAIFMVVAVAFSTNGQVGLLTALVLAPLMVAWLAFWGMRHDRKQERDRG